MKLLSNITESAAIWQQILLLYLSIINIIALIAFGLDKRYAKLNKWRIPEKRLLFLAAAGGSAGALLGMYLFRHKTRKWKFRILVPVLLVVQIAIAVWVVTD